MTQRLEDISLREYIELRLEMMDKALALQAREYERRLEMLNHEAQQLKNMQATYVSQDLYRVQHGMLADEVSKLRDYKSVQEGRSNAFTVIVGIIVIFASTILSGLIAYIVR